MLFLSGKKAFTIVEVMIVVAVLAMMCAFIFPRFASIKISSNEKKTRQLLKRADMVLKGYKMKEGCPVYPDDINAFLDCLGIPGSKTDSITGSLTFDYSGYMFVYLPGEPDVDGFRMKYDFYAVPLDINITGIHSYVINENGVLCIDCGSETAYVDGEDFPVL